MRSQYKYKLNRYNPEQRKKDQYKILIFEEHQARRDFLRSLIFEWGYIPFSFESEPICFDNLASINPDLVLLGPLPLERFFSFLTTIKLINSALPILMISEDQAIEEFIAKKDFTDVLIINTPLESNKIKDRIIRILNNRFKIDNCQNGSMIIGNSPEILKIRKMIPELINSKEAVLIKGETGTGKDLVAKVIHCMSDRSENPLVKVNSASLTVELFERELLGCSEKKNTGTTKKSKLETANRGAIFFDDIDRIPADLQPRLLQLIEKDTLLRLLPESKEMIDIRIIAAADADLDSLVERGKFRKDLFYRLNVFSIEIPPLRDRIEDIPLLTDFFIDKFCGEFGKSNYKLSQKTQNIFCSYHWPGNVRELENFVKDALVSSNEGSIFDKQFISVENNKPQDLINNGENIYPLVELKDLKSYMQDLENFSLKNICREFLAQAEKKLIKKVLEKSSGNRKKAAMILEISYRSLLNKIKTYKLT